MSDRASECFLAPRYTRFIAFTSKKGLRTSPSLIYLSTPPGDRSIGNLRRRAPDGNQCYFILIQKEKRKKGKAQDSKQKKKKKRKRRKKNHLAGFEPPALSPEDLSFSAPHTIRPPAHGLVTSFPAYTNLTDK